MHTNKLCTLYKKYQSQVNQRSFRVTGVKKNKNKTKKKQNEVKLQTTSNDKSNSVNVLVLGKHA